ncbi:hypothetical protein [Pantoea sp.]|uniref:hypothetical protein n=1 Tax=Pantoea sp. TaxID=69393 RepID=UPI0028ABF631|nr:hypothetical protein [Pantoea sp.]
MSNIIYSLYDALGLEIDGDDPVLIVDEELTIYFNESDHTLEMCCPVGPLPNTVDDLQRVLQLNYSSPVVLATDADKTALLSLLRLPATSSAAEVESGLHQLISVCRMLCKNGFSNTV